MDKHFNLSDISIRIEKGKCNLIIGESGSGKTVLMKTIVGLLEADQGSVLYDRIDFTKANRNERNEIRRKTGMLFQNGALFDSLTIEDNIRFPLDMFTKLSLKEKRIRVEFCLSRVGLQNVNKLIPAELSGGMKKRAAIARAIALEPEYLFCDEPNSGLDPVSAIRIDKLIMEITKEFEITTIVNSHDMNSVLEIGENVFFLKDGQLAWEGSNKEILHTDNKELNSFVFANSMAKKIKPQ